MPTSAIAATVAALLIGAGTNPLDEEMVVTPGPQSLAELESLAPRQLLERYEHGELCERSAAYWHLCRLNDGARPLVPLLVDMLDDPWMRRRAIWLLGSLGTHAEAAIEPVIRKIEAREPGASELAVLLGRLGPRAVDAAPVLISLLEDDPDRKLAILRALLSVDAPPSVIVPALIPLLTDASPSIRQMAIVELGDCRDEAIDAFDALFELRTSERDGPLAARSLAMIAGVSIPYAGQGPADDAFAAAIERVAAPWVRKHGRDAGFRKVHAWYDPSQRTYVITPQVAEELEFDISGLEQLAAYLDAHHFNVVPDDVVVRIPKREMDEVDADDPPSRVSWPLRCK